MGLGEDDTGLLVVAPTPAIVQELSQVIENRERVEVRYQSSKDVAPTDRLLEPFVVFSSQGNWYTHAHDVGAEGLRTFRVDRIESLTVSGQAENEAPDSMPEPGIWFADAEIERVTLGWLRMAGGYMSDIQSMRCPLQMQMVGLRFVLP